MEQRREKRGRFGRGVQSIFSPLVLFVCFFSVCQGLCGAGGQAVSEPVSSSLLGRRLDPRIAGAWGFRLRCGLGLAPARVDISAHLPLVYSTRPWPTNPRLLEPTHPPHLPDPSSAWRCCGLAVAALPAGISANPPQTPSPLMSAGRRIRPSDPCPSGALHRRPRPSLVAPPPVVAG